MGSRVFMALLHYPVYNRVGEVVATAITNLDLHDLARVARTYEVERCFVVSPLKRQRWLIEKILNHWRKGFGASYNPTRRDALSLVEAVSTLEEVKGLIEERCGAPPKVVATTARTHEGMMDYDTLRGHILKGRDPYLLLFGTGWGLAKEVLQGADILLKPIQMGAPFNHLSVRSAAAVILDRLFGDR